MLHIQDSYNPNLFIIHFFCAVYYLQLKAIYCSIARCGDYCFYTTLLVAGGIHTQLHWEEFGLILDVPPDALPLRFIAEITVRVSISGPYVYSDSDTWKPASAVDWISSSRDFVNPVLLGIQHSVRGNVKSSKIKVLMADDRPTQNMSFVFQDYSNFTLDGPYVYLLLNHFSGISIASTAELNFEGILFKSQKANYVWDYSFVVYKSHTDAINEKLLAEYAHWRMETKKMMVLFEEDNREINLNLPSLKNWNAIEKTSPLVYYKDNLLSQNSIQSNMQFILGWEGHGYPSREYATLHLSGTIQPVKITFYTMSIEDEEKKQRTHMEKQLDTTDLKQVLSSLKSNNYDASTWHRLCLSLGLLEETLNTIKADEDNVNDCLRTCLHKWLKGAGNKGGATWTLLEQALKDIDQKTVAENMRKSRAHSEL